MKASFSVNDIAVIDVSFCVPYANAETTYVKEVFTYMLSAF